MQFNQPFDARSVDPSQAPAPLPPGDYKVRIVASEPKPTKEGDGGYLELKLSILEGQFANRELFYRLNLFNKSKQAVDIAYSQLSALCHVTGVFNIQASEQLHNIPFIAVVVVQSGGIYNDIKGVKDLAGNQPGKGGVAGMGSGMPQAAPPVQPGFGTFGQPPQQAAFPPQQQPAAAPPWGPPAAQPPQAAPAAAPWQAPAAQPPAWGPPGAPPQQAAPAQPQWSPQPPQPAQAAPAPAAPPWAQGQPPQAPTWPPK